MDKIKHCILVAWAYVWAALGNSRTLALAFAFDAMAALDELKVVPWSDLLGAERGGRVAAMITTAFIFMRLITRSAVSFDPKLARRRDGA